MIKKNIEIPGYTVIRKVGQGGMATVYLARQQSLKREVILKILNLHKIGSNIKKLITRFMTEGQVVASLQHPNILTIYDIGVSGEFYYIAMEYIEGGDLKQKIARGISVDKALDCAIKIARALHEAHQKGIIHRDVKPANILFRKDGTPLLGDFGIAKRVMPGNDQITATGTLLGSPNYVSPEQIDNQPVDARSDIYSLGCTLYEMLMGKVPYRAKSMVDLLLQHRSTSVPTLSPELSDLQPLINRMLAKNLGHRFQDANIMANYAERLLQRRVEKGTTPQKKARATIGKKNRVTTIFLLLTVIISTVIGTLHYALKNFSGSSTDWGNIFTPDVKGSVNIEAPNADMGTIPGEKNQKVPIKSVKELLRLGHKSLQDYRLTHPPRNNAYYYFSELLRIDPENTEAKAGLAAVTDKYIKIAEYALTKENYDKALDYVRMGLMVSPKNKTLLKLKSLLEPLVGKKNKS